MIRVHTPPSSETVVTIFGATGFLGRHIVLHLARKGLRLRVMCRSVRHGAFLKPMGAVGQVEPMVVDLEKEEHIRAALAGAHYFVNAVGTLFERHRNDFQKVHVIFARNLARLAHEVGCLGGVHISALGATKGHASAYAHTKALGEEVMAEHMPNVSIVRPSLVFGPEDKVFNMCASWARISPFLPVVQSPPIRFQPVYVGDVAQSVARMLLASDVWGGKTVELGGPSTYTLRELIELTLKMVHRKCVLVPVPFSALLFLARLVGWVPYAPITPHQVQLLASDNVLSPHALTLEHLGISAHALEDVAPLYLRHLRPGGEYGHA